MKFISIENIKRRILNYPAIIIIIPGLVIIITLLIVDYNIGVESRDFYVNLTTGAIEVFLLGLVIIVYNKLIERNDRIKRYKEEIDSYRPWKEPEATFRICGIIRSLNSLGETNINLNVCFLFKAPLFRTNLQGATFISANLRSANLFMANLKDAHLFQANLQGANLIGTQLQGADLSGVELDGAEVDCLDWLEKLDVKGLEYLKEKYQVIIYKTFSEETYHIEEKQ